ncbi:condensation domain-containing protein, partial [Pseudomassariella vexata]
MELKLQRLWSEVLGVGLEAISPEDNFFRLGGDSVTAMKLAAAFRRQKLKLSVKQIFSFQTIALQAASTKCLSMLDEPLRSQHGPMAPFSLSTALSSAELSSMISRFPVDEVLDVLPATHFQHMIISRGVKSSHAALNYPVLNLGRSVEVERLQDACRSVVAHLEVLRTVFVEHGNRTWQIVLRHLDPPFYTIDQASSRDDLPRSIITQASTCVGGSYPMLSFTLVYQQSSELQLVVGLSHAQYDGFCMPQFLKSLSHAYYGVQLPRTVPFSTYMYSRAARHAESVSFWKKYLEGSRLINLSSHLSTTSQSGVPSRVIETSGMLEHIELPTLPNGITVSSFLQAAWALTLLHATNVQDMVYAIVVAGRNSTIHEIDDVVGPCVNIIPVRLIFSPNWTALDLVKAVQSQVLTIGEQDSLGFNEIVQQCTDWPSISTFDAFFQSQNVDEHPEHNISGSQTQLQWMENPYVEQD